jgi:hypothetical protein
MEIITKQKLADHPLESYFDVPSNSTIVEYKEIIPDPVIDSPQYDDKDKEIENKIEEVYSLAIAQATIIGDEVERVEGKYKARIGEVSATMLTVALGAIREKSALKMHKDKVSPVGGKGPHTVNNNLNIVADRNELLRIMLDQEKNK